MRHIRDNERVETHYWRLHIPNGADGGHGSYGLQPSLPRQVIGEVRCNVSEPIPVLPGEPTYFAINISSINGTLEPLGIWYTCNATPTTSLPSLLYLNLALKYVYTYNNIVIRREDWFPVYIIPMQLSNT
ncbi:hypothetical protein [Vulcanisaeta sp. JCM 14467]|uniref:hypothetical protein n=1 Tax=Vulcanisaeta sp. JCM 14467 TaxID=1295370 RepID=UPI000A63F0F6|nr:hypothetical protein [Vulcanisaeta sp. JCM 14467]